MAINRATKIETSIREYSEKVTLARKAISEKSYVVQNVIGAHGSLATDRLKGRQAAFTSRNFRFVTDLRGL